MSDDDSPEPAAVSDVRKHVEAIAARLDLSRAHVERTLAFLATSDRASIEAASALAPLIHGVRSGGRWSIDAASAARLIGKPVTLVVTTTAKGVECELITGKVRINHDRD